MLRSFLAMCLAAALLLPLPALAHGTGQGPNGGQLQHMEGRHFELKVEGRMITLYLLDLFNKPLKSADAKVTLAILSGGQSETVELAPAGNAVFKGESRLAAGPAAAFVATVSFAGAKPVVVRYGGAHAGH